MFAENLFVELMLSYAIYWLILFASAIDKDGYKIAKRDNSFTCFDVLWTGEEYFTRCWS